MSTPNVATTQRGSFFSARKMWFWIAVGLGLITTALLTVLLQTLTATTTYYVVNSEVPARTQITEADLTPIVTSQGGEPPTALDISEVQSGDVYSLFTLQPGDILTASNAGSLSPLTDGLPTNFVIASFTASPNMSAGGNVKRGDYIDISYIGEGEGGQSAKLLLQRVLVIDATTDLEGAAAPDDTTGTSTDPGSVTSQYRAGVPSLYTVGVSQEDALKLALATQFTLYLTLSSADSVENGVDPLDMSLFIDDLFSTPANNAGAGTSNTFDSKKVVNNGDPVVAPETETPSSTETPAPEETNDSSVDKDGNVLIPGDDTTGESTDTE